MKRVSGSELRQLVIGLQVRTGKHYTIENAPCFGGWGLDVLNSRGGWSHVTHRMPAIQMRQFLKGMLEGLNAMTDI